MEVGLAQVRGASLYLVIRNIDQMDLLNVLIFCLYFVLSVLSLKYIWKTQTASSI